MTDRAKSSQAAKTRATAGSDETAVLVEQLQRLADGHFDVDLPTATPNNSQPFAIGLEALRRLRERFAGVDDGSTRVLQSADQNRLVASKLDEAMTTHARELGHAGNGARDLAASIDRLRDETADCHKLVNNSITGVKRGQSMLSEVTLGVDAVRDALAEGTRRSKRLAEGAQQMTEISRTIDELSQQANVLAVNASLMARSAPARTDNNAALVSEIRRLADHAGDVGRGVEDMVRDVIADAAEVVRAGEQANAKVVSSAELANEARRLVRDTNRFTRELLQLTRQVGEGARNQSLQTQELLSRFAAAELSSTSLAAAAKNAFLSGNHLVQLVDVLKHSSLHKTGAPSKSKRPRARPAKPDRAQTESTIDDDKTLVMDPIELREQVQMASSHTVEVASGKSKSARRGATAKVAASATKARR